MLQSVLKIIRGIVKLRGDTDDTLIGNDGDALKVSQSDTSTGKGVVKLFPGTTEFTEGDVEPQQLSRFGSTWVTIADSEFGAKAFISPNGVINAEGSVRLIGDNFIDGKLLLAEQWNFTSTNGGTQDVVDGELQLSTGTIANGAFTVETSQVAPFLTATFNFSHLAISIPAPAATDCTREWGCYDPDSGSLDGITFRLVNGALSVRRYKNGVVQEDVAQGSWNGNNTFVLDANIHVYEIFYNAGTIFFEIDGKLYHKMVAAASAAYGTPHLKLGAAVENTNGNTTENMIVSRGLSISRFGSRVFVPRFKHIVAAGTYIIKNTPGQIERVVINDIAVGSATVIAYNNDAASGQTMFSIDTTDVQGTLEYGFEFDALTLAVTGNFVDVTVVYY